VNDELERILKETVVAYLWHDSGIRAQVLLETTKNGIHDSLCPDRDANRASHEYSS
jgi:hypothetical protein